MDEGLALKLNYSALCIGVFEAWQVHSVTKTQVNIDNDSACISRSRLLNLILLSNLINLIQQNTFEFDFL